MKRFFALFAAVMLLTTTAFAGTFNWGINAGTNISKADGGGWKTDATNGWYLGVTTRFKVPILNFGMDASLNYSQERIGGEGSKTMKQLNIPLHIRYDFSLPIASNAICPYLMAGPQFNYDFNDINQNGFKFKSTSSWKFDLGAGVILGNHVQISYAYAIAMGDSFKGEWSEGGQVIENFGAKVNTHRIGVAYFF